MKLELKENLNNYLKAEKFTDLLQVQKEVFPILLKNDDLFCQSPTGTGKTLAYLLPIINNLDKSKNNVEAIIIVPTNELVQQLKNQLQKLNKYFNFDFFAITKNLDYEWEKRKYHKKSKIIVTTIEKIFALQNKSPIDYRELKYLIVDEIDMIYHFKQLDLIAKFVKNLRLKNKITYAFFSATLSGDLQNKIKKTFKINPKLIDLDNKLTKKVDIKLIKVIENDKLQVLKELLESNEINPYFVIIFANKNEEVKKIYNFLNKNNFKDIRYFNSDLNPRKRKQVFNEAKNEKIIYLITTDLYARGIDFNHVSHIINYDLPIDLNYFKHRIGRTNRVNDLKGKIYLLFEAKDKQKIDLIKAKNENISFKN
ncbi:MAG: helicase [Candidatus Hepatoplasma scabrum]|nr:MAG: helicase [Candidatus Hepatoplasma sp.]